MIDQNLINYVKTALAQGHSASDIKQVLLTNGWQEDDVNHAIAQFDMLRTAPVAPNAPVLTSSPATTNPKPVQANFIQPAKKTFVSPYSTLLAVVLFFSLFILVNKMITDTRQHFSGDTNGQLVFDAILILPFILAASILHFSFLDRKEKFLILSQPYYIVSGWLILRLLWNVSKYILDANSAYGVYIVLILVIAVLTGIVFFIQKFMRHKQ